MQDIRRFTYFYFGIASLALSGSLAFTIARSARLVPWHGTLVLGIWAGLGLVLGAAFVWRSRQRDGTDPAG